MARSTFKVLFYVNGSKEKDGIVPIMGRVTINGTVAQFSCKQTIPKTLWDAKGNRAKGKSAEARNVNLALDNIKAQIIKHYQRISDREAYVTAEMVRNAYQGVGSEYETLIKAFDKDCANFLKRVGKDRSIGTYKVMVRARNYVAAFIKSFYRRTDMSMLELTPDFIKEFAAYLTAERGLKNATMVNGEKWILSKRHKTNVPFQVKLLDIPLQIIERYKYLSEDKLVFGKINYWTMCKQLKKVMAECGIEKQISYHCARHTFGTLALSKGMPIESVSRVLGHTNIVTTQIYAKITTQKLDNDLTMFGNKLNASFGSVTP